MRSLAEARLKRIRAVELVAEGMSYEQIAKAVGYSHRGSAHRAVFKALNEREVEDVDGLRALESARMDRMLSALWSKIEEGDVDAILAALKISDSRVKLFNLDSAHSAGGTETSFISMVVGPLEGNPEEATLDDVRRWSAELRAVATSRAMERS